MGIVKEFIFRDIISVSEQANVRQAIRIMKLHRTSALVVVTHLGNYVGCIGEADLLHASLPSYMKSIYNTSFMANLDQILNRLEDQLDENVSKYIDKNYPVLTVGDSLAYAADLMHRSNKTILPVLDGKTWVGMISRIDILAATISTKKKG